MERPKIAIIRGDNPREMVNDCLHLIGVEHGSIAGHKAFIKPNYVLPLVPDTGVTTDTRIVEAVIETVRHWGFLDVTVGDGGSGDTERAFEIVGIRDAVRRHGVRLCDLNRDDFIEVTIPAALALGKVRISRAVIESDILINLPKLKCHHLALITVGMKNLMGVITPKSMMHERLHEKIVDLVSLLRPKLTIVDGLVGLERDEISGHPVRMNIIIGGKDVVAVDTVSAAVMGINPKRVRHIQLAYSMGLGIGDLSQIEIVGESIEDVMRNFELPKSFMKQS